MSGEFEIIGVETVVRYFKELSPESAMKDRGKLRNISVRKANI
jgi:hypothetical protein